MKTVVCIKNLYKSTYKGLAFRKNKNYQVVSDEGDFIFIKDEENHSFNFSKAELGTYYSFNDYFMVT